MYIFFDIGGTKMRVVASRNCKEFTKDPTIVDAPLTFEEGMKQLLTLIEELREEEDVEMIGGGIAGPFQERICSLVASPNLTDWVGKPLHSQLREAFNAPVFIENDAAVVGLGEMHFGAGKGFEIGVYITVSTGVGGARFVDGFIDHKAMGFEPGHQIIDAGMSLCPTCAGPTLQDYVSGKATEDRLGMKPYAISQDDPMWEEYAKYLSYGMRNTVIHWSPDVLILGGSMIVGQPAIPFDRTALHIQESLKDIFPEMMEIKKAELEDFGGLYGAMALVNHHKATHSL